ncbi:hypothetical protein V8F20_004919 [Naviculisporaceae sp. PSN 640]
MADHEILYKFLPIPSSVEADAIGPLVSGHHVPRVLARARPSKVSRVRYRYRFSAFTICFLRLRQCCAPQENIKLFNQLLSTPRATWHLPMVPVILASYTKVIRVKGSLGSGSIDSKQASSSILRSRTTSEYPPSRTDFCLGTKTPNMAMARLRDTRPFKIHGTMKMTRVTRYPSSSSRASTRDLCQGTLEREKFPSRHPSHRG